ncbi:D-2-hydroxyacid dehydrogenase [Xanthovirga aplysinae]|uniref:D-2-hydroxyacid dehydrogenase n=1 Tax=Xanthovirga aplysinae TaxID=2529853 RepID=UPI0012BCAF41|nr:D-2-hydroxyacid dehydrogenase [Xanthovirga aplysinae]MTI32014.1 D-2-hydroxyacid dehydrogenase [Xanthovirga aplysinae]
MKIVITDGYTINPGDLDWEAIEALGDTDIYDRTPDDLIIQRCKKADIVLTSKTNFDKKTLDQLPQLKHIGVMATGYNNIDINACHDLNISVSHVRAYSSPTVAQHTFSLLLELCNQVGMHSQSVQKGGWQKSPDFCYWEKPITELYGKTMGLLGFGDIAKQVAAIALAFGMKVLCYRKHPEKGGLEGVHQVNLEKLFKESDVISLHCPLSAETNQIINQKSINQLKNSCYIINTSRGGLINEKDLAQALEEGKIAGAGLDVLSKEPPTSTNPLLKAPNCIITPHNAWASKEARKRLIQQLELNLRGFLEDKPINTVSP